MSDYGGSIGFGMVIGGLLMTMILLLAGVLGREDARHTAWDKAIKCDRQLQNSLTAVDSLRVVVRDPDCGKLVPITILERMAGD